MSTVTSTEEGGQKCNGHPHREERQMEGIFCRKFKDKHIEPLSIMAGTIIPRLKPGATVNQNKNCKLVEFDGTIQSTSNFAERYMKLSSKK